MFISKIKLTIINILQIIIVNLYKLYKAVFNNKANVVNNALLIEGYYDQKLLIYINPLKISYYLPVGEEINGVYQNRFWKKFICEGNWEESIKLINDHRKTKAMYELIDAKGQFKEINAYKKHVYELEKNQLNTKNEPRNEVLDTMEKINEYYCENYKLFNKIKDIGFLTTKELNIDSINEIGVAIGRNGELYRYGNGYHRMAIAKYLKLNKIPVKIRLIHTEWYNYCKQKHDCDPIEAVLIEITKRCI